MAKFKIGDVVSFPYHRVGLGTVLLVNGSDSLLVDVGVGNGHDGCVEWTRKVGWSDNKLRCWFVQNASCTLVKSKVVFKGNK